MITTILIQDISTAETRSVTTAVSLSDGLDLKRSSIDKLASHISVNTMPVGSVEFVREYMKLAGIVEPVIDCYPKCLERYMHRPVHIVGITNILDLSYPVFVKPVNLKTFNGFVYRGLSAFYDEHDSDQITALFENLPITILVSGMVKFQSEWRYYISDNKIIGAARYDPDGADDAPVPDIGIVEDSVRLLAIADPYVLDFSVLDSGLTALVEFNDAWAIGLYSNALLPKEYLQFLMKRWESLIK